MAHKNAGLMCILFYTMKEANKACGHPDGVQIP